MVQDEARNIISKRRRRREETKELRILQFDCFIQLPHTSTAQYSVLKFDSAAPDDPPKTWCFSMSFEA
jgi:hypothetical protein